MSTDEILARAREFIAATPVMSFLGFVPVAGPPGAYVVEMPVTADTLNVMGSAHGGALATLVDHAGGYGATVLTGRGGPTADLHIRYLAAAGAGTCRAEGRVVREGGRLIVMAVDVHVEGTLVASASLTVAPGDSDARGRR